jgi:hypothetical protein
MASDTPESTKAIVCGLDEWLPNVGNCREFRVLLGYKLDGDSFKCSGDSNEWLFAD